MLSFPPCGPTCDQRCGCGGECAARAGTNGPRGQLTPMSASHGSRCSLVANRVPGSPPEVALPAAAVSPWAPLDLAEANAVLTEGGYQLRVSRERAAVLLIGPGAGSGVPLGTAPRWTDLYRMLIRLRRTRQRRDPTWLYRLMRALHPDAEPDTAPQALPAGRGEIITADADALSRTCAVALATSDGRTLFPDQGQPHRSSSLPLPGRAIQLSTRSATAILDADGARRQLRGWGRLATAIAGDPMLRMHCATQPVPAAVLDSQTDSAALARVCEPAPRHPAHPGGTVSVTLSALLKPGSDGTPTLLRQVLDNRFERREEAQAYFLEHFIRPLLRTFRLALDTHRIGLLASSEAGVEVELSPELQATGRVVITDYDTADAEPCQRDTAHGARCLSSMVEALCAGFAACHGNTSEVRRAAAGVLNEELRYLAPRVAELLRGTDPLRDIAHSVSQQQDSTLKTVLNRVQERTRSRRWNPRLGRPTVVIDLDLCGIVPLRRIIDASRAVSGPRPGAPDGIVELASPDTLPLLPTHVRSTWWNFLEMTGIGNKYPEVDWWQVHADFIRAFRSRTRENSGADTINAGLSRFVWDVRDAGGCVVFSTSRHERHRTSTREVLATAGVPNSTLLCLPDDHSRPMSEVRVEQLRELADREIVAVFDDRQTNRMAIVKEFPDALAVAVEIPGLSSERQPGQTLPDTGEIIATFETTPRPQPDTTVAPRLSHTHSLEELQVGALRRNRLAQRWSVRLTARESRLLVRRIVADADQCAARTARTTVAKFGLGEAVPESERHERTLRALHHVFTRKQFLKGSRSNYRLEHLRRDAEPFLRNNRPIDIVLFGFPVKQCLNRLKAVGPLPDLAELGALARLRQLSQVVKSVYPPGVNFNILTDGRHFRTRPYAITESYRRKLTEYVQLVGMSECTSVEEIDTVAAKRLGPGLPTERAERIARYRRLLATTLQGFDITDDPLRTLDQVHAVTSTMDGFDPRIAGLFREMLMSLVYSVPVVVPPGVDRISWSTMVYADVYNVTDSTVSVRVRRARAAVLRRAWQTVLGYLATLQVDEEFGYERMFPDRVRLTVTAGREGCLGFTYLGGSGLLPWQGTGVIDRRGNVAVDFAISLLDRGFVPVYSPLLGPRQPWMMVPAQRTILDQSEYSLQASVPTPRSADQPSGGMRLDEEFAARVRLRRN